MKKAIVGLFCIALSVTGTAYAAGDGYTRKKAIISVQELKKLMDDKTKNLVVVAVGKKSQYLTGHIPGSLRVWRGDYTGKDAKKQFGGMLMSPPKFQKFARKLGINNDSTVVVYDYKYDATRLWWAFYHYGKDNVRVLNGGMKAWKKAGYPINYLSSPSDAKTGNFVAKPSNIMIAQMDAVTGKSPNVQLWDTREKGEWNGSKLKKGAFRKGRVPHATFLNWKEFRDMKTGKFKTAKGIEQVVQKFNINKDKEQVFYCQSGVRTTQEMFALYLIGFPIDKLKNYDGSWIEYSFHKKNPVTVEAK